MKKTSKSTVKQPNKTAAKQEKTILETPKTKVKFKAGAELASAV